MIDQIHINFLIKIMEISQEILKRKGARKAEEIPQEVIELLDSGKIETVNLTEWLAVDQLAVLKVVLKYLDKEDWYEEFEEKVNSQKKISANNNTKVIGEVFSENLDNQLINESLSTHSSDIVRGWACWAICLTKESIEELAEVAKYFAADQHFGLREVVIFATKDKFAKELEKSIALLAKWTGDEDENVRRFVAEVLRPTGVWTKKIPALHENPEIGLPLIAPLKSDPSKYVQNSVANWLNDASKSKPDWVKSTCEAWESESDTKATKYIVKRALRTINK